MSGTRSILKPEIIVWLSLIVITILVSVFAVKNLVGSLYYITWKDSPQKADDSVSVLEEKTAKLIPSNSNSFYELGRHYRKIAYTAVSDEERTMGFNLAEKYLIKAILLQPGNSYYLSEYARVAGGMGDIDRAIKYFEISVSLSKTDAVIHSLYASWSLNNAKKIFRIEDLDFLVMMYKNPEEVVPFYEERLIGGIMVKMFISIAEREWGEALRLGIRKSRSTYRNLGDLYLMTFRPDKAIENYKKSGDSIRLINSYFVEQDFDNVFNLVKNLIETNNRVFWSRWDEIRKLLNKAAVFDLGGYEAYYWLGKGYYQQYMFEEAIENLEKATTLKPGHVDGHFFLAKSYEAVKKTDMAIKEYTEVLKIKPGHKEATVQLGNAIKSKL
ncbi:MAG: tetratricopeptide repeat protein [Candidatus Scalindua rubra]|uniref:O-linked GlcNAc transferase n=1 Tax=Candidatus Scalindua brodae TaxID=237368 RepID=A0A0B0EPZ7_9BACT|nr:MAG: O-linked GlcNAc transferase [Candidatus Scalindua brodae]MBZ0108348.1 tetratricopeptide repeat protein [Candidatus Scalindua rubra]TWU34046.1 Tetratricopeptide repeat protein [Candidatus Brocadiaceae bacterium S225]